MQKDRERQDLLEWLSSSADPSANHNMAIKKREADTGTWFLESNDFCQWVNSPGLLWLYGIRKHLNMRHTVEILTVLTCSIAGCGKSSLLDNY